MVVGTAVVPSQDVESKDQGRTQDVAKVVDVAVVLLQCRDQGIVKLDETDRLKEKRVVGVGRRDDDIGQDSSSNKERGREEKDELKY